VLRLVPVLQVVGPPRCWDRLLGLPESPCVQQTVCQCFRLHAALLHRGHFKSRTAQNVEHTYKSEHW